MRLGHKDDTSNNQLVRTALKAAVLFVEQHSTLTWYLLCGKLGARLFRQSDCCTPAHDPRELHAENNPYFTSILAHINLTVTEGSIFKSWYDPWENKRQLMGCFVPALWNDKTEEKVQRARGEFFFISFLYKEKYLYMNNGSCNHMYFSSLVMFKKFKASDMKYQVY